MYRLGLADLNGDLGQPRRPKDGVKWLKRAAEVSQMIHILILPLNILVFASGM